MKLPDIFKAHKATFSFEFFPPKTDQAVEQLFERAREMAELRPAFVSVTYGAGGTTRERTHDVVVDLKNKFDLTAAAHLTCVGHTREDIIHILNRYHEKGIQNIVALRGDLPEGHTGPAGELAYANELVELIREQFGDHFGIAVAGYPEGHPDTVCKLTDLDNLKRKVDAGADAIITQLFFDNRDFHDFRATCELQRIDIPIIAGLMPIVSEKGVRRMAGMCGSRIPPKLLTKLQKADGDAEKVLAVGIDWATQQSHDLLENQTAGIHFYTLNKSKATHEIYRRLGARNSDMLESMI